MRFVELKDWWKGRKLRQDDTRKQQEPQLLVTLNGCPTRNRT